MNIDEFFHFLAPTVPFILGRLGIPIFGNKAIPSWLWHSPNDHFSLFLSQAENDLPPHGQCLTGTEPGPLIEGRTWLYTLLLLLFLSFFLLPLPLFGDSFFYSISVISNLLFFHRFCSAFFPIPHVHSLSFFPCVSNDPPLFKLFSRGCTNPSFSSSVHRPFQKSSEETMTEQVYNLGFYLRKAACSSLALTEELFESAL